MSSHSAEDMKKHVRVYLLVFGALAVLTLVTVGASYLKVSVPLAIALGMLIASIKGSLVACFFMHLISERTALFVTLSVTVIFFVALIFLPVLTNADMVLTP